MVSRVYEKVRRMEKEEEQKRERERETFQDNFWTRILMIFGCTYTFIIGEGIGRRREQLEFEKKGTFRRDLVTKAELERKFAKRNTT